MDILSHGLWGGASFGRGSKKIFWIAFFFGVAPDLFSFGVFFVHRLISKGIVFMHSSADIHVIPSYVNTLYNYTHSLVIFSVVFFIVSLILKRPVYEMCSWGLHVALDVFTHSYEFFPTPFLFPISDYKLDAIGWHHPVIFIPNVILLILVYSWFYYRRRSQHK